MPDTNQETTDAPLQSEQNETKQDPRDVLTPDHPRFQEIYAELKELKAQREEWNQEKQALMDRMDRAESAGSSNEDTYTEEELRSLEKIERGLRQRNSFATQEDIRAEKRALEYERLSQRLDGSDGMPKFVPVEVEAFAKSRGISNLEDAYFILHRDAYVQQESKKLATKNQPFSSEKPTGGGDQNFSEGSIESIMDKANKGTLTDAEYDANREKIHAYIKAQAKADS